MHSRISLAIIISFKFDASTQKFGVQLITINSELRITKKEEANSLRNKVYLFYLCEQLEEGSIARHKDERKVKTAEEESLASNKYMNTEFDDLEIQEEDEEETGENAEEKKATENEPSNELDLESSTQIISEKTEDNLITATVKEEDLFPETSFKLKLVATIEKYN